MSSGRLSIEGLSPKSPSTDTASLESLPDELLCYVFKECLSSGGFEDLALTCKRFYAVSQPYVEEHNKQMQEWMTKSIVENSNETSSKTTLDLFKDIAQNPDGARHVQYLDLRLPTTIVGQTLPFLKRSNLEALVSYIAAIPWFAANFSRDALLAWFLDLLEEDQDDQEDQDAEDIEEHQDDEEAEEDSDDQEDNEDSEEDDEPSTVNNSQRDGRDKAYHFLLSITAVLLTLMRNVERLTIPSLWTHRANENPPWRNTVSLRLQSELSCTNYMRTAAFPFSGLSSILPHPQVEDESYHRSGLEIITPFLSLLRAEFLYADNLTTIASDLSDGLTCKWPERSFTSNFKRIAFESCCLEPTAVRELLQHAQHVESFTYSHGWNGLFGRRWSAGALIEAIGECCGGTIRELTIRNGRRANNNHDTTGTHSLKQFVVLEKCTLALSAISGPALNSRFSTDRNEVTTGRAQPWTPSAIRQFLPSIENIMPASLKSLVLKVHDFEELHEVDDATLRALFPAGRTTADMDSLPRLEKIAVDGFVRMLGPLEEHLMACGVVIVESLLL